MDANALKQYIALYDSNLALIDKGSGGILNDLRREARAQLDGAHLPAKGDEDYEHTDLDSLLSIDYGLNIGRVELPVNPAQSFSCKVPNMSTAMFFLLNDTFARTERSTDVLPAGVTVCSLRSAAERFPELMERYYGSVARFDNELTTLNTMLVQDGVFVHIGRGVKADKTIQLVNILRNSAPLMAVRRLLIVAEEDSEARMLICDHTQDDKNAYLSLQTIEIVCCANARFDLYDLEESSERTTRLSSLYARMERGSNLLIDGITLFNGKTRNEYYADLNGEDAELRLLGMGIEDRSRQLDTYSLIRHNVPRCRSNELFKYVVDEEARGAFSGRIYVAPHAVKTEAYQSNRNIVGAPEAKMFSKPQLEIYNDDVKCSHGTAIGQLDELQIFYMRTRGLTEDTAKKLLKQAFMSDVIDGVRVPELKDRLRMLVEHRFSGVSAEACAGCGASMDKNCLS